MEYLKVIMITLILESGLILGCCIERRKVKGCIDVDHRRRIENITQLLIWTSLCMLVVVMTSILLQIT